MSKIPIKGEVKAVGHKETVVAMSRDFNTEEDVQDFIREQRKHGCRLRIWAHKVFINGRPIYRAVRRYAPDDEPLKARIWDGEEFVPFVIPIYTSKLIKEEPPMLG